MIQDERMDRRAMQQSDLAGRTSLQPREEAIFCARSMIKRFRETKPSSRPERRQVREQLKAKDLWGMRDASPTEKAAPSCHEVDKVMSQDIQRFIITRGDRADSTSREPSRVIPSPAVSAACQMQVCTSRESYPRTRLLGDVDPETRTGRNSGATDSEDRKALHLLDPKVYTGTSGLRGGRSATSPKANIHHLGAVRHGGTTGATVASAADVASDLDGVLRKLRDGMVPEQFERLPWKPVPRTSFPVSLSQIALDLDAKLLEFTLMANAREHVVEEAHKADEAEKDAWRQRETRRVEDMVRQENTLLQDAATTGGYTTSSGFTRVSKPFIDYELAGFPASVDPTRDADDLDDQVSRLIPTKCPALPPGTLVCPVDTDATVEAVAHEMAGLLRTAGAKMERIEALWADGSTSQEGGSPLPTNISMKQAKTPCGRIVIPSCSLQEDQQGDDATARTEDVRFRVRGETPVSPGPESELVVRLDGSSMRDNQAKFRPTTFGWHPSQGHVSEHHVPNQAPDLPEVIPAWSLNGHASLRQAGERIKTELDVAMLYMQRQLDKIPVAYSTRNAVADDAVTKRPYDSVLHQIVKKTPRGEADAMKIEGPSTVSFQQSLKVLADGMSVRPDTHTELNDGLGLVCMNDGTWCENGSATTQLQYRRRVQRDAATKTRNLGREIAGKKTIHAELFPEENLECEEQIEDIFASETPVIVPPVHASADGTLLRLAPRNFGQQPCPKPKPYPSHFSSVAGEYFENTSLMHGSSSMSVSAQQHSSERHSQPKDGGDNGAAVARARRRLYAFRRTRQGNATGASESDLWPRRSSGRKKTLPKRPETRNATLTELKVVRSSLN